MKSIINTKSKLFFGAMIAFVAVILVLVVGVVLGVSLFSSHTQSSYYAVYLNTGDLYFGQMSKMHDDVLSNVWYLQRGDKNLALAKFSDVAWGPAGDIRINDDNIVWTARISQNSKLMDVFNGTTPTNNINASDIQNLQQQDSQSTK